MQQAVCNKRCAHIGTFPLASGWRSAAAHGVFDGALRRQLCAVAAGQGKAAAERAEGAACWKQSV